MRLADERSFAYHRAVAERLRAEPAQLEAIRKKVVRWIEAGGRARPYAEAWLTLIDAGLESVLAILEDPSERAIDLRHASPFAGVVPARERWRLWKALPSAS